MDIRTELQELMQKKNYSLKDVAIATGAAKFSINMRLNKTYNGDNSNITDKINNFIQREKERCIDEIPIVETSIVKYIAEIGRLCHTKGRIGVCAGKAGIAKPLPLKNI